jgi:hypothetical protein
MAGAVIVLLTGGRSPNQCADGDGQGLIHSKVKAF